MEQWAEEMRKKRRGEKDDTTLDIDALGAMVCATIPWASPERVEKLTVWQGFAILEARAPQPEG